MPSAADPVPVLPGGYSVPDSRGHQGYLHVECEFSIVTFSLYIVHCTVYNLQCICNVQCCFYSILIAISSKDSSVRYFDRFIEYKLR